LNISRIFVALGRKIHFDCLTIFNKYFGGIN